ncbi:hypothetical protein [Streptomyces sp. ISL-100]|uniref:hypothetical protein n=1 Tax=Streptomyces sp. ISL-100 TaxID=2819173 RepID=UPI001BE91223|nr:hypothetical protein [Streptomyces sp. ISL-100]MBT2394734.1 hypothetical protein [Streptomyces sp. ISL-100]
MSRRKAAGVVAVVFTVLAGAQQVLLVAGFGGWLPGWQPWPYLLVAAPAWLISRPLWGERIPRPWRRAVEALRRVPSWAYAVGVLALAAGVWAGLQDFEPYLGHEEAVYANKARSWADGTPDAGWGVYRPVGLPALGALALWLYGDGGAGGGAGGSVGGGVGALRAVGLVLVLGTLTVTYLVAAAWTSRRRAVVVVLVLLSGLGFLRRVPEYLNDIGATGLVLVVVFLLVRAQVVAGAMPGPTRLASSTVPVAREIGAAAQGRPCLVVTGYEPEFGWYSGCDAVTYAQYREMRLRVPEGTLVSLVVFERGRLQPDAAGLERLARLARVDSGRDSDVRTIGTDGPVGTAMVVTMR